MTARSLAWVDAATRRVTPIDLAVDDMRHPRISPDGRELAFHVIAPDGVMNVWTQRLDGPRVRITSDPEAVSYPEWSPDGLSLAVEIKRGDQTFIGVVAREGGPVTQLTFERGQSWPHSWAPDNDRIAFAGERDGVWNVYAVSRRTRAVTALTRFNSAERLRALPRVVPSRRACRVRTVAENRRRVDAGAAGGLTAAHWSQVVDAGLRLCLGIESSGLKARDSRLPARDPDPRPKPKTSRLRLKAQDAADRICSASNRGGLIRSVRWRIATLLSAAIAISYLDRQALSVAIKAVQHDIPLSNTEFSQLQAAFLARLRVHVRRRRRARRRARHAARAVRRS